MTWSMGELESQEQWVRGAEGRGVGPGGAGSNDTGKQASRAPGAGTPGAGRLQMMTPSSGRTGTGEKTADTRRPGRWGVVTELRVRGPGAWARLPTPPPPVAWRRWPLQLSPRPQEEEQGKEETQGQHVSQGTAALPPAWSPTCASGSPNAKYGSGPARLGAGRARGVTRRVAGWPA